MLVPCISMRGSARPGAHDEHVVARIAPIRSDGVFFKYLFIMLIIFVLKMTYTPLTNLTYRLQLLLLPPRRTGSEAGTRTQQGIPRVARGGATAS